MQDMQRHQQTNDRSQDKVRAAPAEPRSVKPDASDHPLVPSKRVVGEPVFNQAGEEIGRIEDIALDKKSGKVAYAILSFGGFLGMGQKHQPLPWTALDYNPDRGGFCVDITEEFLKLAPKLDTDELSGWDDSEQREAFYRYYAPIGATPYWT